jgi:hypothetical protein
MRAAACCRPQRCKAPQRPPAPLSAPCALPPSLRTWCTRSGPTASSAGPRARRTSRPSARRS